MTLDELRVLVIGPPLPTPAEQRQMVDDDAGGRFKPGEHDAMCFWAPEAGGQNGFVVWVMRMKSRPEVDILTPCLKRGGFGHSWVGLFRTDRLPLDWIPDP